MLPEEIPQTLIDILDQRAGKKHSRTGSVVACLAEILTEYDEMPRGRPSTDGTTRESPNGYHYTRIQGKWRLTHHLVAEKMLGRPIDTEKEMVRFKTGNKLDLRPENIEVIPKNKVSVRKRLAHVEAKIAELQALRDELLNELKLV